MAGKTQVVIDLRSPAYLMVTGQVAAVQAKWGEFFAEFPNGMEVDDGNGQKVRVYFAGAVQSMHVEYNTVLQNVTALLLGVRRMTFITTEAKRRQLNKAWQAYDRAKQRAWTLEIGAAMVDSNTRAHELRVWIEEAVSCATDGANLPPYPRADK